MLNLDCIGIEVKSQGYEGKGIQVSPDGQEAVLIMEKRTGERNCPEYGQSSYINDVARMQLKDVPIIAGRKQSLLCLYHQYQCPKCGNISYLTSKGGQDEVIEFICPNCGKHELLVAYDLNLGHTDGKRK